ARDRMRQASIFGASVINPWFGAGALGLDFAARHQDDPNWKEALVQESVPMAATAAGGGLARALLSRMGAAAAAATLGGATTLTSATSTAGDDQLIGAGNADAAQYPWAMAALLGSVAYRGRPTRRFGIPPSADPPIFSYDKTGWMKAHPDY